MKPSIPQLTSTSVPSVLFSRGRGIFAIGLLLLTLGLPNTLKGQLEFIEKFDNGSDAGRWGHYDPGSTVSPPQNNSRFYTNDFAGGLAYRQYAPGTHCANIINRGG